MAEKGESSNERSEEKGQEEVSDDGSTWRETVMDSNAAGPSASVPETRARFRSSSSLIDHRREPDDPESEWEGQADELVSEDVINDVCQMYCNVILSETSRINAMSQPPNSPGAFRELARLRFPSSFQDAFKARFGAVANGQPLASRDHRLLSADAEVPDYLKNILDEYGLSGIFANKEQSNAVHVDDQSVYEGNGRSGHGYGDRGSSRLGHSSNVRHPSAPSHADDGTDTHSSGSEAKEMEEVE